MNVIESSGLSSPVLAAPSTKLVARAAVIAEIRLSTVDWSTSFAAGAVCFHFSSSWPSLFFVLAFSNVAVWSPRDLHEH